MSFLTVFSQTTLLNNARFFVFALYDASAPTVLLEKIAPAKPYGDPLQVTFTYNMQQGHIYRFRLWESVDDTATGLIRNSANVNGSTNSVAIRLPIYAEVDVTPNWVSGQPTVADATYVGWTISKLTRNPDYLVFDDAPDNNQNDVVRNSDGFTLQNDINLQPNEQWCVEFAPQIIIAPPSANDFSTGRIITTDTILTAADKNQMLIIRSATSAIKITVADSTTITDFIDRFYIKSEGGNQINVVVDLISSGDTFAYYSAALPTLYLGQSEDLFIFCFNKQYFLTSNPKGMGLCGSFLYSDNLTVFNYILCAGQLLSRAVYPMLWAYVQGLGTAVSLVTWNVNSTIDGIVYYPNRGFFNLGDGSTTFGLPDFTNMTIKSAAAGTAGQSENQMSLDHLHGTIHATSPTGGGAGYVGGSGGTLDTTQNKTGPMTNNSGTSLAAVGQFVRVASRLKYCLIRIG